MRALLLDIETAANTGFVWGKYKQDVIRFKEHWYILSFAWKWYGNKQGHCRTLADYPLFNKEPKNDRELCKKLHELLTEADVVIAQNGDSFDIKKINARLLVHGFKPPATYQTIDTLKVLRSKFGFSSNKLDDVCDQLGIGRKKVHTGFDLWERCMNGERKAFRELGEYNLHDVEPLLEELYEKIRPWMTNHPNMGFLMKENGGCPVCAKYTLRKEGVRFTRTGKRQRYQCISCGAWSYGELLETRIIR